MLLAHQEKTVLDVGFLLSNLHAILQCKCFTF